MILDTASAIEAIQLLFAAVGFGLAFWELWIAIENGLTITSTESTDLRRIVAETQIIGELFRIFLQGCLVAVGIISVLLPPPPNVGGAAFPPETLQSVLTRFGLITLTIAMVADSLVQEYRRRTFLASVRLVGLRQQPTPDQVVQADRLDRLEDVHNVRTIKEMGESIETQAERRFNETQATIAQGTAAAHAAYEEANSVNIKISDLNERLLVEQQRRKGESGA